MISLEMAKKLMKIQQWVLALNVAHVYLPLAAHNLKKK
jgi:hypothetical protein